MSGSVPFVRAAVLTHRLLLRQLVTRGRIIALLALGGVLILAALGVAASAEIDDQVEAMVGVIDGLGLVLVVPVVALVFASASLGDGREDGTLVYLWLRPMDRLPVVIGAFFASITVSLPLTVVPMAIAAAVGGSGSDGIIATVVASGVGVLGYSALFVLLGLLVKNAIIWGLAYVLLWEGLFTQFSSAIGRVGARLSAGDRRQHGRGPPQRSARHLDTDRRDRVSRHRRRRAPSGAQRLQRMEID